MDARVKKIYMELYQGIKKKSYLAELFNVTPKTIENTIAKYSEDIVMDRELGGYRFNSLLPSKIPVNIFFQFLQDSIDNPIIKNDFISLSKIVSTKDDLNLPMISTKNLSDLSKNIIKINVAIKTNCTITMDYIGGRGELEKKYIKPHKIFVDISKYYLYGSYIEENTKNVGEYRTFALNGISRITPNKYIKDGNFEIDKSINAYGIITKDTFITLNLKPIAANFFKREGFFHKDNFDFIIENIDGSVIAKMYYNDIQEVVNIVQRWMPFISVEGENSIKVYEIIKDNYKQLSENF